MRRQANQALVSAVWRRSSASPSSWTSRYAERNKAGERPTTNASNSDSSAMCDHHLAPGTCGTSATCLPPRRVGALKTLPRPQGAPSTGAGTSPEAWTGHVDEHCAQERTAAQNCRCPPLECVHGRASGDRGLAGGACGAGRDLGPGRAGARPRVGVDGGNGTVAAAGGGAAAGRAGGTGRRTAVACGGRGRCRWCGAGGSGDGHPVVGGGRGGEPVTVVGRGVAGEPLGDQVRPYPGRVGVRGDKRGARFRDRAGGGEGAGGGCGAGPGRL